MFMFHVTATTRKSRASRTSSSTVGASVFTRSAPGGVGPFGGDPSAAIARVDECATDVFCNGKLRGRRFRTRRKNRSALHDTLQYTYTTGKRMTLFR